MCTKKQLENIRIEIPSLAGTPLIRSPHPSSREADINASIVIQETNAILRVGACRAHNDNITFLALEAIDCRNLHTSRHHLSK